MLKRALVEELIYGNEFAGRFTQDSPILPDVWIHFAENPVQRADLLITPYLEAGASHMNAGLLCKELSARLGEEAATETWKRIHTKESRPAARIAYNQSTVAAALTFAEVVRVVLPMSKWWKDRAKRGEQETLVKALTTEKDREALVKVLSHPRRAHERTRRSRDNSWLSLDVIWMIRVVGTLALAMEYVWGLDAQEREKQRRELGSPDSTPHVDVWPRWLIKPRGPQPPGDVADDVKEEYYGRVVAAVTRLLSDIVPAEQVRASVYSVSLNRRAGATIWRSTVAVKADAACRVFDLSCSELAWAVIDSGIDARHPAFRKRYQHHKEGREVAVPMPNHQAEESIDEQDNPLHAKWRENNPSELKQKDWTNRTRVVATYDFTIIRELLSSDSDVLARLPPRIQKCMKKEPRLTARLRRDLQDGMQVDWSILEKFIQVPHSDDYESPTHEHGTHVAGIIGADWRVLDEEMFPVDNDVKGLCPDIKLYDLRVLDANGEGDEFNVMAAMQFIRHLNAHQNFLVIHGVNLSLSIPHDVANYACGRTPVCDECERLIASGIVVVAAAGNEGYLQYITAKGPMEGYRSISITDPGNTDGVITVGSTHRDLPHTYGVSYFSSRGPTGDGRAKPDLVAPGEKIESPVPNRDIKRKDGTSMAAPHVSGAAALLIARHRELAGQPKRIKEVLCSSATDLGRERYFQGAGMLDILRALQSV